jgi:hypothetical protein
MSIEVPTEDLDRIANIIRMKSFGGTLCWEVRGLGPQTTAPPSWGKLFIG